MSKIRKKWFKSSTNRSRSLWSNSNHYSLKKRKMRHRMSKCSKNLSTSRLSKINWRHCLNGQLLNMLNPLRLRCSTQSSNTFRNQLNSSNLQIKVFLQLRTRWARSRKHLLEFLLKIMKGLKLLLLSLMQVLMNRKMDRCHALRKLLRIFQIAIRVMLIVLYNLHRLRTQRLSKILANHYMMKTLR